MRSGLASTEPQHFDCIVILADESHGEADPDARSIMSLILLQDILARAEGGKSPRLVSEILDPRNRELIARAQVTDIVVSPQIVSMLLTQISQQQMLESLYDILLSAGGVEIYLKPATHYVTAGSTVSFAALAAAAQNRGEIALGVSLASAGSDGESNNGVRLNPARDEIWTLTEVDRVIVLAENLYD
jgi:ion channel POLLUX/CASTOR